MSTTFRIAALILASILTVAALWLVARWSVAMPAALADYPRVASRLLPFITIPIVVVAVMRRRRLRR